MKTPAYAWNQPIPADPTAYLWRVRRTDAEGNPGAVVGAVPVHVSRRRTRPHGPGQRLMAAGRRHTLHAGPTFPARPATPSLATSGSGASLAGVTTPGNAYATTKAIADRQLHVDRHRARRGGKALGTSTTGNFRVDSTAPTVKSMKPAGSATPTSVFVVTFSEKVKGVSAKTVKLYQKGKKKPLKAKVAIKGTKVKLKPKGRLKKGKTYLVKFNYSRIMDQAGNALVKPKKWQIPVK